MPGIAGIIVRGHTFEQVVVFLHIRHLIIGGPPPVNLAIGIFRHLSVCDGVKLGYSK
jgi:hypothetical protein